MGNYFPANGTEGRAFEARWCDHCLADAAFRADPGNAEGCPILLAASSGDHGPIEVWIYEDNEPVCLRFEDNPANPQPCRFTPDLFAQEAAPVGAVAVG